MPLPVSFGTVLSGHLDLVEENKSAVSNSASTLKADFICGVESFARLTQFVEDALYFFF
jgi:hypothetical protein